MGVKDLKNRKVVNFSIDIEILEKLDEYSKKTGIPKTKIYDFALRDYLNKSVREATLENICNELMQAIGDNDRLIRSVRDSVKKISKLVE